MSRNYYYLVSGLPDLSPDETAPIPDMADFVAEAALDLAPDDLALLQLIRHPYDNRNLVTLLCYPERDFDPRGCLSRDVLVAALDDPSTLPSYMADFLTAYHSGEPGLEPDDRLAWQFYDSVAEHPNPFIRAWFDFDLNVRNLLAAINCRALAERLKVPPASLLQRAIVGDNAVADHLRRSNAPDFSLSSIFPEVEQILSFSREEPVTFEKRVDQLRIRTVDELVFLRGFKIDAVLAFVVKLDIAWRWRVLDDAAGRQALDALIDELKSGLVVDDGEIR